MQREFAKEPRAAFNRSRNAGASNGRPKANLSRGAVIGARVVFVVEIHGVRNGNVAA
jgi:hypothetical protein